MLAFLTDWTIQQSFWEGLLTTLRLSGAAGLAALAIGFCMAFARVSGKRWLSVPAGCYVELFRNTPLLIQLYIYYRGLQSIGLILPPEWCGFLALALYSGAYITEVFRSGLLAIPRQQTEAGMALGLGRFEVYRMILIPQAIRLVMPPLGNQLISLAKNSSLVAFITVNDLFMVIYKGAVDHFMPVEYFIEGALLYLSIALSLSALTKGVEWWLSRKQCAPLPTSPPETGAASYG